MKKNKGKRVIMVKGGSAVLDGVLSYMQGDEGKSGGFQEEVYLDYGKRKCKIPMFGYSRNSKKASGTGIETVKGVVENRSER